MQPAADYISFQQQIDQVRTGLPMADALTLMEEWSIPVATLASLLGMADRTLRRCRAGDPTQLLPAVETDRLMRVNAVLGMATDVLEDSAVEWIHSPVNALGQQTPLSIMDTDVGCSQVTTLLGRIQHGVFS